MWMTKLEVSYPPPPPRQRRERVMDKAKRLVWAMICGLIGLSAVVAAFAALLRR
jgi:hypothetical protein